MGMKVVVGFFVTGFGDQIEVEAHQQKWKPQWSAGQIPPPPQIFRASAGCYGDPVERFIPPAFSDVESPNLNSAGVG